MKPDFTGFWENMWLVVLLIVLAVIFSAAYFIRYYVTNRKITVDASVLNIQEDMAVNPTMTTSRGVPLASAVSSMNVTFSVNGENGQIILTVPGADADKLVKGMRGQLCYRGHSYISFIPER
ncbi:MAG TPA: hypothetical protein IAB23_04130 [Candidatus Scybalocola faecavium]|nr:hypothetical protein [Candidatus Scybalocola faecavium]